MDLTAFVSLLLILHAGPACVSGFAPEDASPANCVTKGNLCSCEVTAAPLGRPQAPSGGIFKRLVTKCCKPDIVRLQFQGELIERIPAEAFKTVPCHWVQEITLAGTGLTGDQASFPGNGAAFEMLPNLRRLVVVNNTRLTRYPDAAFRNLELQLEELILSGNPVTNLSHSRDLFRGLLKLQKLDLGNNALIELTGRQFQDLPELKELTLDGNRLTRIDQSMFSPSLGNLSSLSMGGNPIKTILGGSFMHLRSLNRLKISSNSPAAGSLAKLSPAMLHGLSELEELTLEGLGFDQVEEEALMEHVNLQVLSLARNQFKHVPSKALVRLAVISQSQLQSLDLAHNEIACLEAEAFGPFNELQWLNLQDNLLTAIGDKAFNGLESLTHLNLRDNPIRYLAPMSLVRLKKLQGLSVGPFLDRARKDVGEAFDKSALGLISGKVRITGLESMGIQYGGNHQTPLMFDASSQIQFSSVDCPIYGEPGVDFPWKNRPGSLAINLSGDQAAPDSLSSSFVPAEKKNAASTSWIEMLTSKKYLIVALIITTSLVTVLILVIIIMYQVRVRKRSGSDSSLLRRSTKNTTNANSASEYGGSAMSAQGTTTVSMRGNEAHLYPSVMDMSHHREHNFYTIDSTGPHSICCPNSPPMFCQQQPNGASSPDTGSINFVPPPYPQHTRSPHQLLLNFSAMHETNSNGSGGTLVSGHHHPLLAQQGSTGGDSSGVGSMCYVASYQQSPRTKSASTEQTNTPSSLDGGGSSTTSGLGGSSVMMKPGALICYRDATNCCNASYLYSPSSPASSNGTRDRLFSSPGFSAGSNCSSPRHLHHVKVHQMPTSANTAQTTTSTTTTMVGHHQQVMLSATTPGNGSLLDQAMAGYGLV